MFLLCDFKKSTSDEALSVKDFARLFIFFLCKSYWQLVC